MRCWNSWWTRDSRAESIAPPPLPWPCGGDGVPRLTEGYPEIGMIAYTLDQEGRDYLLVRRESAGRLL
jgi:hypothetical protein